MCKKGEIIFFTVRKKLLLFLVVVGEIAAGAGFLSWYVQLQNHKRQQVLGAKVAKIPEAQVVKFEESELKNYYEFKPREKIVDRAFWLDHEVTYQINNDGLNDLFDYPVEKQPGKMRIVILGDSFTYGQYVDTQNNWSEILERKLNALQRLCGQTGFEVINLGMPGFDVQELVRRYQRLGQKYQPDLIIWLESGSGFIRFNEILSPKVNACLNLGGGQLDFEKEEDLVKLQRCVNQAEDELMAENSLVERGKLLQNYYDEFFSLPGTGRSIIFYYDFYYRERGDDYPPLIQGLKNRYPQVTFIDEEPFDQHNRSLHFVDGHPNLKGQAAIAETIYDFLVNRQLLCGINN